LAALLTGRYRQSKRLASEFLGEVFQIPMSLGAVCKSEQRVSDALAAPYTELHEATQKAPWANVDETGWREDKARAWLWVMATATATVLMIHPNRSKEAAQKLMGSNFKGVAITDRYSAYQWLPVDQRQTCWSHLDRDFQAMVDRGGQSAEVGQALGWEAGRLFKWRAWVEAGRRPLTWLAGKVPELQRRVREALERGSECKDDKTSGVCREILALFPALWTWSRVAGVEATNNLAERELRPAVQMRKLSFGTDSARGSRFFERIMTAVMTLRRQKRPLLDWVAEAYEAFRTGRPPPSLLPQPP
jgi:transposase